MSFSAQVFSFVLVPLISLFLFIAPAFAQTPPTNTDPNVPNNLHTWTQNLMIEVLSSMSCLITGVDPVNPGGQCLGVDVKSHKIGYVQNQGGAIGVMGNLIAMTFNTPVHTSDFTRYMANNFGIAKKAYADAGTGFNQLSPLLNIWTYFRNISYLLFVLVFVAIGFAIMFRVHIDPRTVMTIENQIPKIIIALIIVTFSFAIVGFLIDLMYIFMFLLFGIFSKIDPNMVSGFDPSQLFNKNAIEVANSLNPPGSGGVLGQGGVFGFAMTITSSVIGVVFSFLGLGGAAGGAFNGSIMNDFIHGISGGVGVLVGLQAATAISTGLSIPIISGLGAAGGGTAAGIAAAGGTEVFLRNVLPNVIIFLIITVAMLFALFRLWFTLIQAYIFLLLDVILAPFWIIAGLVPGTNISFSAWLRETASEVVVFPATLVMFLLGRVLINAVSTAQPGNFFLPPFIGDPGSPNLMGSLIGFGMILMTPQIATMVKAALKAPKIDISAISQAVGVGMAYPVSTAKGVAGTLAGSREFRVEEFDKKTNAVKYGRTGALRSIMNRFGR